MYNMLYNLFGVHPHPKSFKSPVFPRLVTLRLAVLASGRGSNLQALLDAIDAGWVDARVDLVICDRPAAPCLALARERGVPAVLELRSTPGQKRTDYDAQLLEVLQSESPDLVVLTGFMRILGPTLCEAFPNRMVNIHPALLPAFKGAHGIRDTLQAGARIAGCTTHFVTADLDGGPIILQAALAVGADDTKERLAARVLELEHQILPCTIQRIAEGRVTLNCGKVRIASGPSWLESSHPAPVRGALYADGY